MVGIPTIPQQGFGGFPPQQAFGGFPPQQGFGGFPPQQGFGGPPPQQGFGAPVGPNFGAPQPPQNTFFNFPFPVNSGLGTGVNLSSNFPFLRSGINGVPNVLLPFFSFSSAALEADIDNIILATGNSLPNLFIDNVTKFPPFLTGFDPVFLDDSGFVPIQQPGFGLPGQFFPGGQQPFFG